MLLIFVLSWLGSATAETMKFTVYSEPVELRYGEVHNRVRFGDSSFFPEDVVARYAKGDKLMAISGFDVDMVRKHADGTETRVLLSDHYLHHYIVYFGQKKAMQEMIKAVEQDHHVAHMMTGCHAMKGGGVRQFQSHMKTHSAAPGEAYDWVAFGSASGAEYRHNPQRFEAPYRILLLKPEAWAPTMHIINTNVMDNRTELVETPPAVSRLLECPCTPQRKIDVAKGTIDGKAASPPIDCSKNFSATGNPSCHLSSYVGGWRCCEDGVFVVDTDKECKLQGCTEKPLDKVYMKFTFLYQDAENSARQMESAACCDVTSEGQGDSNIEYDVTTCAPGTPPDQCVHIAESVQPIGYYGNLPGYPKGSSFVEMVFAAPHLHWAGLSLELFDHATNKKLCEVHRSPGFEGGVMYGNGTSVGNENGYLVGLRPCSWNGSTAPRFRRDHLLRTRAVYNATSYHTGVMSLWLMQVAAVPDSVVV
jgi:hypothetical protein